MENLQCTRQLWQAELPCVETSENLVILDFAGARGVRNVVHVIIA